MQQWHQLRDNSSIFWVPLEVKTALAFLFWETAVPAALGELSAGTTNFPSLPATHFSWCSCLLSLNGGIAMDTGCDVLAARSVVVVGAGWQGTRTAASPLTLRRHWACSHTKQTRSNRDSRRRAQKAALIPQARLPLDWMYCISMCKINLCTQKSNSIAEYFTCVDLFSRMGKILCQATCTSSDAQGGEA